MEVSLPFTYRENSEIKVTVKLTGSMVVVSLYIEQSSYEGAFVPIHSTLVCPDFPS